MQRHELTDTLRVFEICVLCDEDDDDEIIAQLLIHDECDDVIDETDDELDDETAL